MPNSTRRGTWSRVAFGDVVRLSKDRSSAPLSDGFERYVGLEHIKPNDLKICSWGKVADGTTFTSVFRPGQVLFGKRRAYQRKVAVAEFSGVCSGDIYVFEPADDRLLPELLPFICQTERFFDHAVGTSAGSLSPRTNWKHLSEHEFALPPLEEQRRIVEVLQASTGVVERLRSARQAAVLSGRALLDILFSVAVARRELAGGTDLTRARWVPLGQIAPLQAGFAFRSSEFSETGDRLLRGSNIAVNATSWEPSETRYWPVSRRSEFAEYILNEGDIVIAMDRPFVGGGFKIARLRANDMPCLLLQRVGRFQVQDEATRELVWAFTHSPSFQWQLQAQQEGTDLPHISKAQIESTLLPLQAASTVSSIRMYSAIWRSLFEFDKRIRAGERLKEKLLEVVLA